MCNDLQDKMIQLLQGKDLADGSPLPGNWWERLEGVRVDNVLRQVMSTSKPSCEPWTETEVKNMIALLVDELAISQDRHLLYPVSMKALMFEAMYLSELEELRATKEEQAVKEEGQKWRDRWRKFFTSSPNPGKVMAFVGLALSGAHLLRNLGSRERSGPAEDGVGGGDCVQEAAGNEGEGGIFRRQCTG